MPLVPLSPTISLPQSPQKSLVVSRYSSSAFVLDGAFLLPSIRCCTRSNRSGSMMAGIPSGITVFAYLYSPMYFLFLRMTLSVATRNADPFRVRRPRLLSESAIVLSVSPLS